MKPKHNLTKSPPKIKPEDMKPSGNWEVHLRVKPINPRANDLV